ncbi:M23 family metallopeptidase [Candidatus Azambacteria bacterium]|nr:M23 family metallopeptidase [Candidatus Azambacteria bacterium]
MRGYGSDAVYEEAIGTGRGGTSGDEQNQYAYPTTPDDVLVADFAPLVIDNAQTSRDQIVYYVVEDGDTVSEIATRFGIEANTLLWANNLSSVDYIKAGQRLEVLPVDGVKYEVKKGDTVDALAQRFKSSKEDIIAYNHLPADGSLRPGDALILPDGAMLQAPRIARPTVIAGGQPQVKVNANKYFIFPTTGRRSQGLHGYNGVDLANECGTPIYAAADGEVTSVRTTNSRARVGRAVYDGYGNHVKIMHPNGVVTLYGHLKDIYVFEGQNVRQGSMIATMGGGFEAVNGRLVRMEGAGRSTGCHLHFEVRGARNPLVGR